MRVSDLDGFDPGYEDAEVSIEASLESRIDTTAYYNMSEPRWLYVIDAIMKSEISKHSRSYRATREYESNVASGEAKTNESGQ